MEYYDVCYGDRIVLPRLTKAEAETIATQMGEGYTAKIGTGRMR